MGDWVQPSSFAGIISFGFCALWTGPCTHQQQAFSHLCFLCVHAMSDIASCPRSLISYQFLRLLENICTYLCETELHGQKSKMPFTCPKTWQYGTAAEGHPCPLEQLELRMCWGISDYTIYLSLDKWGPSISVDSYLEIKFKTKIPKCNIYIIICGCSDPSGFIEAGISHSTQGVLGYPAHPLSAASEENRYPAALDPLTPQIFSSGPDHP